MLYDGEPIINAATIADHLGNDTDRRCGTLARDFDITPVGSIAGAPALPGSFKAVDRSEWPDRIAAMEKDGSRISDMVVDAAIPTQNQEHLSFCWAYSCGGAVMVMRAQQGQPFVQLSPESIAGPVNGYRDGGNYLSRALARVTQFGIASTAYVPHLAVSKSDFKPGWEDDAKQYVAEEFWDLGSDDGHMFDRIMTCLFARMPVPVNYQWWGHSVLVCDPFMRKAGRNSGQYVFGNRLWNSWGSSYGANGFAVVEEPYTNAAEAYALRSIKLKGAN